MPACSPQLTIAAGYSEPNLGREEKGQVAGEPHRKSPHYMFTFETANDFLKSTLVSNLLSYVLHKTIKMKKTSPLMVGISGLQYPFLSRDRAFYYLQGTLQHCLIVYPKLIYFFYPLPLGLSSFSNHQLYTHPSPQLQHQVLHPSFLMSFHTPYHPT